jgi:7,8-dihydropterin-6-yl-methyl-4-(beta-D-ribofuranosyl)aminobenzene 5'-phosphate synthase
MLAALLLSAALGLARPPQHAPAPTAVTILYDAFGGGPGLVRDWGFAALIEYQGKRILFDTGNNATIFAQNVRRLHIDLKHLDFVVISHRHSDHTAGLSVVLRANPQVPIYAPREGFGIFGAAVPGTFYRALPTLPDSMRYFEGVVPGQIKSGSLWPTAHFVLVDSSLTIAPGIRLVALVSDNPGTRELRELSLVLSTPTGDILVVGCSHPGIERILAAVGSPATSVRALFGGLHLVAAPDSVLAPLVQRLHNQWRVTQVAPGHCTGEPAFAALQREYGDDYLYAGLGRRLVLQ